MSLPGACEAFLQPVPAPARTRDARLAALRFADSYREANGRIVDARDCDRDERTVYAGGNGAKTKGHWK